MIYHGSAANRSHPPGVPDTAGWRSSDRCAGRQDLEPARHLAAPGAVEHQVDAVLRLVPPPEHQPRVGLHRVLPRRHQLLGEHQRRPLHLEVAALLLLHAVDEHLERALGVGWEGDSGTVHAWPVGGRVQGILIPFRPWRHPPIPSPPPTPSAAVSGSTGSTGSSIRCGSPTRSACCSRIWCAGPGPSTSRRTTSERWPPGRSAPPARTSPSCPPA